MHGHIARMALVYCTEYTHLGNLAVQVLREANSLDVPKDVVERNIKKAMDPVRPSQRKGRTTVPLPHARPSLDLVALANHEC
eukprot:511968-Pleurochrysis_carterae.AAC.4